MCLWRAEGGCIQEGGPESQNSFQSKNRELHFPTTQLGSHFHHPMAELENWMQNWEVYSNFKRLPSCAHDTGFVVATARCTPQQYIYPPFPSRPTVASP